MKQRKDSQPLSIRMERTIYDRLIQFCDKSGQSKTIAIERALSHYIDDYDDMMKRAQSSSTET